TLQFRVSRRYRRVREDDIVVIGPPDVEHRGPHREALILERATLHQQARERGALGWARRILDPVQRVLEPLAGARGRRSGGQGAHAGGRASGGWGAGGAGGAGSGGASNWGAGLPGHGRWRFSDRPRLRGWSGSDHVGVEAEVLLTDPDD